MNNRKYKINEDFFNIIDSEQKAYFLGFLYADGYISKNGMNCVLTLTGKDREILDILNQYIFFSQKPLYYRKPVQTIINKKNVNIKEAYTLTISSVKIVNDLIKLGCINRKSLKLEFPNEEQVSRDFISHFIRGYFDGDGCISISKNAKTFNIAGTEVFLSGIRDLLFDIGVASKIVKHSNQNISYLRVHSIKDLNRIYYFMYKDCKTFLKRKQEKFERIIKESPLNKLTSNHKNISFDTSSKSWRVCSKKKELTFDLGRFPTEEQALSAKNNFLKNYKPSPTLELSLR